MHNKFNNKNNTEKANISVDVTVLYVWVPVEKTMIRSQNDVITIAMSADILNGNLCYY